MKSRIYSSLILFFSAIFLGSCGLFGNSPMPINYSSASYVRMNDSLEVLKEKLDFSLAKKMEYLDSDKNDKYKIFICSRKIYPSTQLYFVLGSPAQFDYFVYAFKNDKLYYWGNLDDFKRCDDDNINSLGVKISNYLLQ